MVEDPPKETDALLGGGRREDDHEGQQAAATATGSAPMLTTTPKLTMFILVGLLTFFVSSLTSVIMGNFSRPVDLPVSPSHSTLHQEDTTTTTTTDDSSPRRDSKYKATQFISFTINTLGGSAEDGECKGRDVDPQNDMCYLGNTKDLAEDIHHRARIFEQVLDKLKNDAFTETPEISRSSNVLKIVMLPEFFWRGPNGVYSIKEMYDDTQDNAKDGVLIQAGDQLRAIIADDAFAHYLFVAGTVLAAQPADPNMTVAQAIQDAHNIMYYNFATIARGGPGHDHSYFVQKRYISGADFLSRTTLPNPHDEDMHLYGDATLALKDTLQKRGYKIVEHNVVEIDGIRFGIEICLDHRMGQLYNNIEMHEDGRLVDVQLITSAGMAIERGPNPVVPGGVVYLCDGEASSAACLRTDTGEFDPDYVCRGDPAGIKHIPVGGPGYSNFFPMSACWDMEESELLEGYYSLHQTQGCAYTLKLYGLDLMEEYTYYPPSIEIYPAVDLPQS